MAPRVRFSFTGDDEESPLAASEKAPLQKSTSGRKRSIGDESQEDNREILDVNLGILKKDGIYETDILPVMGPVTYRPQHDPHLTLSEAPAPSLGPTARRIVVRFIAGEVGPFKLHSDFDVGEAREARYRLVLHGSVMRRGSGTPALRGNVHYRGDVGGTDSDDDIADRPEGRNLGRSIREEEEEAA